MQIATKKPPVNKRALSVLVLGAAIHATAAQAIDLTGYLNNVGSTLYIGAGQPYAGLNMAGGTIYGGVIQSDAVSANLFTQNNAHGDLDSVTLNGSLDLSGASAEAYLSNSFTIHNAAGTGPGTVNITGNLAGLVSKTTQTLDNATVNLGANGGHIYVVPGTTLTLGSNLQVSGSGYARLAGDHIVNQGTVSIASGGLPYLSAAKLDNFGSIAGENGTHLSVEGQFTNTATGVVTMNGAGGATTLQLGTGYTTWADPSQHWSNAGIVTVTHTNLLLGGYFMPSDVGTIQRTGGSLGLDGYLDNSGATLNIGQGQALAGLTMLGGTIKGGTIQSDNTSSNLFVRDNSGGTLDGVTLNGSLDVTGATASATITGGLTVHDVAGSGPGTINVTGTNASINLGTGVVLDNATLNLDSADSLGQASVNAADPTLNLGTHLDVEVAGDSNYLNAASVQNQGVINLTQFSRLNSASLTNNGQVILGMAGRLATPNVANTGEITGGGIIDMASNGTLTNQGHLAPSSFGLLVDGHLDMTATSHLDLEFGGAGFSDFSKLFVTQNTSLGGALNLYDVNGYTPTSGDNFDILMYAAATGDFSSVNLFGFGPGITANLSRFADHLNVSFNVAAVPIPGAVWLFGSALGILGMRRRRV